MFETEQGRFEKVHTNKIKSINTVYVFINRNLNLIEIYNCKKKFKLVPTKFLFIKEEVTRINYLKYMYVK